MNADIPSKTESIWRCKIGGRHDGVLPPGCDWPMRQAIQEAFQRITGVECEFTFSGWGSKLTESERAVVENREPDRDVLIRAAEEELRIVSGERPSSDETTAKPNKDEMTLRRLLAIAYSGFERLYTDDGELQDGSEVPVIDYVRDSVDDIQRKIHQRGATKVASQLKA